jgi:hypothetical protein
MSGHWDIQEFEQRCMHRDVHNFATPVSYSCLDLCIICCRHESPRRTRLCKHMLLMSLEVSMIASSSKKPTVKASKNRHTARNQTRNADPLFCWRSNRKMAQRAVLSRRHHTTPCWRPKAVFAHPLASLSSTSRLNRDRTLFSYHPASEVFLQHMMALYVEPAQRFTVDVGRTSMISSFCCLPSRMMNHISPNRL